MAVLRMSPALGTFGNTRTKIIERNMHKMRIKVFIVGDMWSPLFLDSVLQCAILREKREERVSGRRRGNVS
jgi:hypothetical protein